MQEVMRKGKGGHHSRYMQKLGLIDNMVLNASKDNLAQVIDALTKVLKVGSLSELVKAISQYGEDLDLNALNSSGFNLLHSATSSGNIEAAQYLIGAKSVDPNMKTGKDDWSAFEIAAQSGFFDIINFFLS